MERSHGIVATGEVTKVIEMVSPFGRELFFDKTHRLLIVVREQPHEGLFLRIHAFDSN